MQNVSSAKPPHNLGAVEMFALACFHVLALASGLFGLQGVWTGTRDEPGAGMAFIFLPMVALVIAILSTIGLIWLWARRRRLSPIARFGA
ncbi:MAG: hypothetical protein AAFQ67_07535, partial [Pseudomonadota bacterium]